MQPGYKNFQPIKKGELLAQQNGKPIYSEWDAYIFMPLYQKQGNDGFFVVTEAQ
jgi:succinylglutamate desuccinylase